MTSRRPNSLKWPKRMPTRRIFMNPGFSKLKLLEKEVLWVCLGLMMLCMRFYTSNKTDLTCTLVLNVVCSFVVCQVFFLYCNIETGLYELEMIERLLQKGGYEPQDDWIGDTASILWSSGNISPALIKQCLCWILNVTGATSTDHRNWSPASIKKKKPNKLLLTKNPHSTPHPRISCPSPLLHPAFYPFQLFVGFEAWIEKHHSY